MHFQNKETRRIFKIKTEYTYFQNKDRLHAFSK